MVIVGAGAAGVSAALWARTLELDAVLLERTGAAGGQLHHVHFPLPDLAGVHGLDGPALATRFAEQLAAHGLTPRLGAEAAALFPAADGECPAVALADGARLEAAAVLVASGCRRRRLDVPGAARLADRGVSMSATRDLASLAGRRVVVVGGGDAAFENALRLAAAGSLVTLVVRATPRARTEFRARVAAARVELRSGTRVVAVHGDQRVEAVELESESGREQVPAEGLVVKIGVEPNTDWCAAAGILDPAGYVQVNPHHATRAPGVWAAGDVTRPPLPNLAVAIGAGAAAMAAIRRRLRG